MQAISPRVRSSMTTLALFGAITACSADPEAASAEPEQEEMIAPEGRDPTPDEIYEALENARSGSLSDAERQTILDLFRGRGVDEADISFSGRIVFQEGDMFHFADELLARASSAALEKGRVFDDINTNNAFPFCVSPLPPCPLTPVDLANPSGSNLLWKRPDTTIKYYLVAPSGAPSYFVQALGLAASRIVNVQTSPTDCLNPSNPGLFEAITLANYNNLSQAVRDSTYAITFVLGTFEEVCGSGATVGCASGPRMGNVKINGTTTSRLRFGHIIGFGGVTPQGTADDGIVNDSGNEAVGIIIHEILHSMGWAHTKDSGAAVVPGTQQTGGGDQSSSIMVANGNIDEPGWRDWRNAANTPVLDRTMLQKLYGNGSSPGGCGYSVNQRTISP